MNDERICYIDVMAASRLAMLAPRLKRWGRLGLVDVAFDEVDEEETGEFDLGVNPVLLAEVNGR